MTETAMHPSAPGMATNPAPENPQGSEAKAHAYAREHGVSQALYAVVRSLAMAALRTWFRVHISGREHIPADGPGIIAPNHKSSLDAFFIGIATRRHVRYMAKVELFKGPLAWLLPVWAHSRFAAARPIKRHSRRLEQSFAQAAWSSCFPRVRESRNRTRSDPRTTVPDDWRLRPARRSSPPPSPVRRSCGAPRCRRSGACSSTFLPAVQSRARGGRRRRSQTDRRARLAGRPGGIRAAQG